MKNLRISPVLLFGVFLSVWLFTSCAPKARIPARQDTSFIRDKKLRKMANEWIGVPYRYGGNTKAGIDCSGFTKKVLSEVYGINPNIRTAEGFYKASRKKSLKKLKEGDLVFFRIPKPKDYHVGVYLGNMKFIHATTSRGVRIDDINQPYYKKSFYKGGTIR